jgi:hypothetical protein
MAENKLSRRNFVASALAAPSLISLLADEGNAHPRIPRLRSFGTSYQFFASPFPGQSFAIQSFRTPVGITFNSYIPFNPHFGRRIHTTNNSRITRQYQESRTIPGIKPVFTCHYFEDDNGNNCAEPDEFVGYNESSFSSGQVPFSGFNVDLNRNAGCLATFELYKGTNGSWKFIDRHAEVVQKHRIPWAPIYVDNIINNQGPGSYCITGKIGGRDIDGKRTEGGRRIGEDRFRLIDTVSHEDNRLICSGVPFKPETPDDFEVSNHDGYCVFTAQGAVDSNGSPGIQINDYLQLNREGGFPSNEEFHIVFANYGTNQGRNLSYNLVGEGINWGQDSKMDLTQGQTKHIKVKPGMLNPGEYSLNLNLPEGRALIDGFRVRKPGGIIGVPTN